MNDLSQLPPDLPVPEDDGAADHLAGRSLPDLALPASDGSEVNLGDLDGALVLYVFPMMGKPGVELPEGWNETPGARGCTVQSLAYSKGLRDLDRLGLRVFGLSVQSPADLQEASERLGLGQVLLSDAGGALQEALELPSFELAGGHYLRRLTIGARDGTIERVWYPVFPPGSDVEQVAAWGQG